MPDNISSAVEMVQFLKEFLVKTLAHIDDLDRPQIQAEIEKYTGSLNINISNTDMRNVCKYIEEKLICNMNEGVALIDNTAVHDTDWPHKRDIAYNYWDDYKNFLLNEGWSPRIVNTLGDVTDKILGLLRDPNDDNEKDRRGLVIGHVQSGKTANYIGLLTKAADAGYKFIIVIAGIHNNLRQQTQQRIDMGFTGRDSTPDSRRRLIGVGLINRNRKFPVSLTNTSRDFTKYIANQLGADLRGFSQPVIIVIKKNVTTLKNLYSWLKDSNTNGREQITNVPMLMIDDEADNASINTNKQDIDPTRTNKEIRCILKLFKKHCYVGYTATPFANIFINPDSETEMLQDDLFPRDFIYCLDAPTNYFGAQRVFLEEKENKKIIAKIEDAESCIPLSHKKDFEVTELPSSLKVAIQTFIVAKAIRILRGQADKHMTMMVNLSRFVNVQQQVKELISYYLNKLKPEIRYNHSLPSGVALNNTGMKALKSAFDKFYSEIEENWEDVQKKLAEALDSIRVYVINGKSDEALDYKKASDSRESLTAIAVGGLSLSRGLTLEGLTVSYMYRNTKMYDTLMQMGRWFGYRPHYDDLCRIWLSDESAGWYEYIAEATEELRLHIKQMQRDHLTPKEFGLCVRGHEGALAVTAANKMRSTETRELQVSFNGELKETYILSSDNTAKTENQDAVRSLFTKLMEAARTELKMADKSIFFGSVNWEYAHDFLQQFHYHRARESDKMAVIEYLKRIAGRYPKVDIAFISLREVKAERPAFELGYGYDIICQERSVGTKAGTEEIKEAPNGGGYYVTNKQRVASRGAESIGLSDVQRKKAEEIARMDNGNKDVKNIADKYYRQVRGHPLIMIHILDLIHQPAGAAKPKLLLAQVPAVSVAFPEGDYDIKIKYVVNPTWLKLHAPEDYDGPDEDDFDE